MADNQTPNFEEIPTPKLTLDPMPGDDTQIVEAVTLETNLANTEKNETLPALDDSLTEEEKLQVEQFSQQIDLSNSQQILMYGAGAQQKMASFSETALEKCEHKI